jgi:hypothetical protein
MEFRVLPFWQVQLSRPGNRSRNRQKSSATIRKCQKNRDKRYRCHLVTQLREHEDPRLYEEAANLMLDAAIRIRDMESRYAGMVEDSQAAHRKLRLAKVRSAPETWKVLPSQQRVRLEAIRAAISNDSYAISFQSMGQYRSGLLAILSNGEPKQEAVSPLADKGE